MTLAIAQAIIDKGKINLPAIASRHVEAMATSTKGWGYTTKDSVANLGKGVSWKESATGTGVGNGVCMKIAPAGIYFSVKGGKFSDAVDAVANISMMTHRTSIGVSSGLAHAMGVCRVLNDEPGLFSPSHFINAVVTAATLGMSYMPETLTDNIAERLALLPEARGWDDDTLIEKFGGGACYVYHSLPFTYSFFLRDPHSIDSLYSVVSAGGDTDSNGSMLAGLLGAVNGTSIFPRQLVDGLVGKDEILVVADQFCDKLGVTE